MLTGQAETGASQLRQNKIERISQRHATFSIISVRVSSYHEGLVLLILTGQAETDASQPRRNNIERISQRHAALSPYLHPGIPRVHVVGYIRVT